MPTNGKAPHKATLLIRLEVHELSKIGESIKEVSPAELKDFDLKTKAVYTIDGFDKFDCLKKLKEVLNGLSRKN